MKPSKLILAILLTILLFSTAQAAPNLKINWLQYSPQYGRLVAEIFNDSEETVDDFTVEFYADNELFHSYAPETPLSLNPKSTIQLFARFAFDGKDHTFRVEAIAGETVEEASYEDNMFESEFTLGDELSPPPEEPAPPQEPDQPPEPVPQPGPGQQIDFIFIFGMAAAAIIIIAAIALLLWVRKKYD